MLDEHDEGTRIGVWVALGVVAMVLFGLIAGVAIRATKNKAPAAAPVATAAAPAAGDDAVLDIPLSGDLVGKVHFALDKFDVPAEAAKAIDDAVAATGADTTRKLVLSGFHDASGDPAHNAVLAKDRAKAVRAALAGKGVPLDRLVLRKPEQTQGDGPPEEARRVEIRLATLP